MKAKLKTYVGTRARIILGIAVIATLVEATRAHPKEPTSKAVASMLGSAIGGSVEDEAFVWEPSLGPWVDLMWGRRVIFVGRMRGQALRDVFRARVRLDRKGTALSIAEHHALTKTTLGDERDLVVGKRSVAYRTVHEDRVVALTVLQHIDDGTRIGMFDTVKHWWKQWTDAGLRAHHVVFETPPQQARIESQTSGWVLSFGDPAMAATFIDGVLKKDKSQTDPYQAHSFTVYESAEARPKAQTITIEKRSPVAEAPAAVHLIESGKPGIEIRLIDTRRLNIGLAVGQRNPVAVTGPGASGDEPTRRRSIIRARFGGGETKADPEAGLVVAKRVLVPLKAHKPTLAIDRFGRAFIGRWPASSSSNASATRWEAIWQASEGLVTNGAIDESETLDLSVRRVTLCTTKDGQLLHAEAKNTTGRALAQALLAHGCLEAITLDDAFDPSIAMRLSEQPLREPVARSHL